MGIRPHDLRVDRAYTRGQLLDAGMHRRHLASAAMTRVLPGYWMRADADADLEMVAAVLQRSARPGTVITRETSAELFGFPLPTAFTHAGGAPLHCCGPEGTARSVGDLVVVHPPPLGPTIRHRGLVMSHPVIALQQIAPKLDPIDLVVCLDALAADRNGTDRRMSLAQIRDTVSTLTGRGAPSLRRALADVRERSWSPMETRMRLRILSSGYPEPELNLEVRDPATGIPYYIDLAYRQWQIAIEYDSEDHRRDRKRWQDDLHKSEVLHQLGWCVLRVSIADYLRPETFFHRLDAAIRDRGFRRTA